MGESRIFDKPVEILDDRSMARATTTTSSSAVKAKSSSARRRSASRARAGADSGGGAAAGAGADHRTRQSRGHERRERIIDEAVQLLAARGFRGTSIAEIAQQAGMTHPGLLYYFGSKERLLREVVAERERVEAAGPWLGNLDEATLDGLPEALRYVIDDAVLTRLYVVLAAENLDDGDPLHDFFVERYAGARQLIVAVVESEQRRGLIDAGVDAAQIGREVIATLMGLEMQWLMDPEAVDYDATLDAYVVGLRARLAPIDPIRPGR
jgi:AcrR family transcriptional regulator